MTRSNALRKFRTDTSAGLRFAWEGPEFLGLLGASQGAGTIAGFALAGAIRFPPQYRPHIVGAGIFAISLVILLLGINGVPALSLLLLALFGLHIPFVNVNIITVIQGATPAPMRGRVVGLLGTLALGLIPIARGLSGLLIDAVAQHVPVIYTSVGLISMAFIATAWSNQSFRDFLATDLRATR